jgi:hypothetical protein
MEYSSTIPLYDRVKNQIYDEFQRLKRQQTLVLTARSKRKKILALKNFKSKYLRFFYEIFALTNFDTLPKVVKDRLVWLGDNIEYVTTIGKVNEVVLFSTLAIRELNITKITYDRDTDSF